MFGVGVGGYCSLGEVYYRHRYRTKLLRYYYRIVRAPSTAVQHAIAIVIIVAVAPLVYYTIPYHTILYYTILYYTIPILY